MRDKEGFIRRCYEETAVANKRKMEVNPIANKHESLVHWVKPRQGWIKVNSEGASRGNPGLAAAGGVLRDGKDDWVDGFVANLGISTAPAAELWGIVHGINMAWEYGFR